MKSNITICKNCQNAFQGKYCNQCGERVYTQHDKSFAHLLEEYFHFITHFEGKFLTTIKTLFKRPGQLSKDYCAGIRKKYYPPLSLFLLLVILYLLFPILKGLNMVLESHMSQRLYGVYASKQVEILIIQKGWTHEIMRDHFHAVSEKVSKFLLFLIIPFLASITWLGFQKRKKVFYDHVIFSTEVNSFLLLWGYLLLPIIFILLNIVLLQPLGFGQIIDSDQFLAFMIILPFILFLQKAIYRFYYEKDDLLKGSKPAKWRSWVAAVIFAFAIMGFLLSFYKLLLFIITMLFLR
jgi:hypothetical protein